MDTLNSKDPRIVKTSADLRFLHSIVLFFIASSHSDQNAEIVDDFSVFFIGYNIPVLVYFLSVLIFYTSSGIFQKNHLTFLPERV